MMQTPMQLCLSDLRYALSVRKELTGRRRRGNTAYVKRLLGELRYWRSLAGGQAIHACMAIAGSYQPTYSRRLWARL